ncbi:uncharacterized protein LOC135392290 [Ornithodoros turicata]|uniref:uncharacterized protein LOC135392290 n=1 Tax=Ornithodoros turicata TaxID=34597 RepID=UPI003139150E
MVFCTVVNCSSRSSRQKTGSVEKVRFFRIPKVVEKEGKAAEILSADRRRLWLARIKRSDLTKKKIKNARVCSLHFVQGEPALLHDTISPDWAPSLNMGYERNPVRTEAVVGRYERAKRRAKAMCSEHRIRKAESHSDSTEIGTENNNDDDPVTKALGTSVQTDLHQEHIEQLQQDNMALRCEVLHLRQKLSSLELTQEHFKENHEYVKFYTGLPSYDILEAVYDLVDDTVPKSEISKLTKFQELIALFLKVVDVLVHSIERFHSVA